MTLCKINTFKLKSGNVKGEKNSWDDRKYMFVLQIIELFKFKCVNSDFTARSPTL